MLLCSVAPPLAARALATNVPPQLEVAFDEYCERLLLREVPKARKELLVASCLITRPSIVTALCNAAERKVVVRLKYDEQQAVMKA